MAHAKLRLNVKDNVYKPNRLSVGEVFSFIFSSGDVIRKYNGSKKRFLECY